MKSLKLISILLLIISISACRKDIITETKDTTPVPNPVIYQETSGDIVGYVYDEDYLPVADAEVSIYNKTVTTNKYGIYNFDNVKLDQLGTYIKVTKAGYLHGSDFIYPDKGKIFSYVHLYTLDNANSFNASAGGVVNVQGGGKITFSPNSISKEDGSTYDGKVNVTAKRLATNDPRIADKMPGSLRGEAINGNTVVLGTYGMIVAELRDDNGNELNIKEGFSANIEFPLTDELKSVAPNEIPLWYFDENKGIWQEDGKAVLVNDHYEGDVSHFSWWNTDAKFPTINLCVKVMYDNGQPVSGFLVQITADVNIGTTNGWTDENGVVCGLVPKAEEMIIKITNPFCDEDIKTIQVGPFENNVVLDPIVIPTPNKLGIGTVVCNGTLMPEAQVVLKYTTVSNEMGTILIPVQNDGTFNLDFDASTCDNIATISIFAYDTNTGYASDTQTIDPNSSGNEIELNVCNDCSFTIEFSPDYPEICDFNLGDNLNLEAIVSGSGTYNYIWNTGETSATITDVNHGLYCVTVSNQTVGCEVIKCIEIAPSLLIDFEVIRNPYCGLNNGQILAFANGGLAPYQFDVTGPDGFNSTSGNLENLAAGLYVIMVTDANNCSFTIEKELVDGADYMVTILQDGNGCESTYLFAYIQNVISNPALSYLWSNGGTESNIYVDIPGEYCVTVTDDTGCEISSCIDVNLDPLEPLIIASCDKNIYTYEPYPLDIFIYSGAGTSISLASFDTLKINVLESGYNFTFYNGQNEACNSEFFLPHYKGELEVSANHPSCSTCEDGSITIDIETGSDCDFCEYGGIEIYAMDDYTTELTTENNTSSLGAGNYVVAIIDNDTGCFIGHKKVILE